MKRITQAISPVVLPVQHSLPNPIVVCTNERLHSLSSVIAKLKVTCSSIGPDHYWVWQPTAILRGFVLCPYFPLAYNTAGGFKADCPVDSEFVFVYLR